MNSSSFSQPRKGFLHRLAAVGLCASSLILTAAHAQQRVGAVWYILMENRNFTENETGGGAQIYGSPAAPYINSLITPGNPNAAQTSWCSAYHSVLSVYDGTGASIHPSEPNYIWMEAGSNFGVLNDNDPYGSGLSVNSIHNFQVSHPDYSGQNFSALMQSAGLTWTAYSEGTNQLSSTGTNANLGGLLTATPAPQSIWTVPLASFSGSNASYLNPYNGSIQWNFATKHTGSLFFAPTNGTTSLTVANTSTTNPEASFYSPLPNLASDLAAGTCSQYNVITPDQYNDMHTALSAGLIYHGVHYTGDLAQIAQGDNFLSIVVPQIIASPQYQNGGAIVIWTDETEGSNRDDFKHTLMEIVISPLAKGNAYLSTLNYTHSSDLRTMEEIFQVTGNTATGFINDAANPSNSTPANLVGTTTALTAVAALPGQSATPPSGYGTGQAYDLSDLFQPGVIPSGIPVVSITPSGYILNRRSNSLTQTVTVTNMLADAISNPVYLEASSLNTTLNNSAGTAANGNPYVLVSATGLAPGASATVTLQLANPASGSVTEILSVATNGTP